MKRSELNTLMNEAGGLLRQHGFHLPPFAFWSPDEWRTKGDEVREIVDRQLGWDITDFGSGDYRQCGLFLFTLRNGAPENLKAACGKVYAEKIMLVKVNQITPMHFHWNKTEDIINRGGGTLAIELYGATSAEGLSEQPLTVSLDGIRRTVHPGGIIRLTPGESITLEPYMYHQFWAEDDLTVVGEVSTVNDDAADNRFFEPAGRFQDLEEDEPPLYLRVNDYPAYYQNSVP